MSKKQINYLGIRFGDNDFHFTWTAIMRTFLDSCDNQNLDKQRIVTICNNISYGMYRLHQNRWQYNNGIKDYDEETRDYLRITEDKVYINDEVLKFLQETDRHNCEFFYVDFLNQQVSYA
jgi:hypothetical protein